MQKFQVQNPIRSHPPPLATEALRECFLLRDQVGLQWSVPPYEQVYIARGTDPSSGAALRGLASEEFAARAGQFLRETAV